MNIFFIDRCPVEAAIAQVDKHVVKMILETAQILSTAHRVLDGFEQSFIYVNGEVVPDKKWILPDYRDELFYKATHVNHPCSKWARESVENYLWLVEHMFALGNEYTHRYGKQHKTITKLGYYLQSPPFKLEEWDWTEPPCAMPEEYIVEGDPVKSYRNYYREAKKDLHNWKNREAPEWIK